MKWGIFVNFIEGPMIVPINPMRIIIMGVSIKEATAVAFISRLWFLTGEFMFFISAMFLSFGPSTEKQKGDSEGNEPLYKYTEFL